MILIPIGTKGSLALKPKMTIGLIIINIIIAVFTFPLAHHSEKQLFTIHRDIFAKEIRLYVSEHREDSELSSYLDGYIESAIQQIETAEDYFELEMYMVEAITAAGLDIEDFESYEDELLARSDDYYAGSFDGSYDTFTDWKRLKAKEDKILNGDVIHVLGLVPNRMNRIHTFFTHLFLHGGIMHLIGNMLFLWVVGCLLEDSWGRLPFLAFYLTGGAFAGLAHCLQDSTSAIPLIGASGAIAAAMGAFTIRHFWTRIKFFYFFLFFFRPFWGTFHLPAFVFLPFWFIEQLVLKSLSDFMGGSDVAYLAHIAGYVMGVVTALVFRATDFEEKHLAPMLHRKHVDEGVRKDPRFDKACGLMDRGNIERARALFSELVRSRPNDYDTIQDIAVMYRSKGMTEDYQGLVGTALKGLLLKSRHEEAATLAMDIVHGPDRVEVNPQYLLRVGKWFTDQGDFGAAHDMFRAVIAGKATPEVSAKASIALAKLLCGKMDNPRGAVDVLRDARTLPLDAEWAERIAEMEATISSTVPESCEV